MSDMGLGDLVGVGGGIPASPAGTLPIGAVDARPGTKLFEIAKRQRQARRPVARENRQADVLASLISKAVPGAAAPAEGMIPFGDLPGPVQQLAGKAHGQPIVGFDPTKLSHEERFMLERLRRMSGDQTRARVDANPQYAAQMQARGRTM